MASSSSIRRFVGGGVGRGNSKDRDLDRELPFIFTETLGAWAAKEREHVVPRMYRTTASDSESGSDGEEDDDI